MLGSDCAKLRTRLNEYCPNEYSAEPSDVVSLRSLMHQSAVVMWFGIHQPVPCRIPTLAAFKSPIGYGRTILLAPQYANGIVCDEPVGIWAYEALRIAARRPRALIDLIGGPADGRLRLVHLDGSADDPMPPVGTPLTWRGQQAGRLGSTAQHYELGPIGLALVANDVPDGATVLADQTPALVAPQ